MAPQPHPPIRNNHKIENVTINFKSRGRQYWLVLTGSQTTAVVTDRALAGWIAKEMGDSSYKGQPNNAKLYDKDPCGLSDSELAMHMLPLSDSAEDDQPECCYLIDGKWICW
jgi:hypothetical protein